MGTPETQLNKTKNVKKKHRKSHRKYDRKSKLDDKNVVNTLKEKYKEILGSREPIIVLTNIAHTFLGRQYLIQKCIMESSDNSSLYDHNASENLTPQRKKDSKVGKEVYKKILDSSLAATPQKKHRKRKLEGTNDFLKNKVIKTNNNAVQMVANEIFDDTESHIVNRSDANITLSGTTGTTSELVCTSDEESITTKLRSCTTFSIFDECDKFGEYDTNANLISPRYAKSKESANSKNHNCKKQNASSLNNSKHLPASKRKESLKNYNTKHSDVASDVVCVKRRSVRRINSSSTISDLTRCSVRTTDMKTNKKKKASNDTLTFKNPFGSSTLVTLQNQTVTDKKKKKGNRKRRALPVITDVSIFPEGTIILQRRTVSSSQNKNENVLDKVNNAVEKQSSGNIEARSEIFRKSSSREKLSTPCRDVSTVAKNLLSKKETDPPFEISTNVKSAAVTNCNTKNDGTPKGPENYLNDKLDVVNNNKRIVTSSNSSLDSYLELANSNDTTLCSSKRRKSSEQNVTAGKNVSAEGKSVGSSETDSTLLCLTQDNLNFFTRHFGKGIDSVQRAANYLNSNEHGVLANSKSQKLEIEIANVTDKTTTTVSQCLQRNENSKNSTESTKNESTHRTTKPVKLNRKNWQHIKKNNSRNINKKLSDEKAEFLSEFLIFNDPAKSSKTVESVDETNVEPSSDDKWEKLKKYTIPKKVTESNNSVVAINENKNEPSPEIKASNEHNVSGDEPTGEPGKTRNETVNQNQKENSCTPDNVISKISSSENNQQSRTEKGRCSPKTNTMEDDSDCISLFAESILKEECDDVVSLAGRVERTSSHSDEPYTMNDDIIDTFVRNTKSDFNKQYEAIAESHRQIDVPIKTKDSIRQKEAAPAIAKNCSTSRTSVPPAETVAVVENENTSSSKDIPFQKIFLGYCFGYMRRGFCYKQQCSFHKTFQVLINQIFCKHEDRMVEIMDYLSSNGYRHFMKQMYTQLLPIIKNISVIPRMFEKLHEVRIINDRIVYTTIRLLLSKEMSLELVANELTSFMSNNDSAILIRILHILRNNFLQVGAKWSTLRSLIMKINRPDLLGIDVVSSILEECILIRKENIGDVKQNLLSKLSLKFRSHIDSRLMRIFENLSQSQHEKQTEVQPITSPDPETREGNLLSTSQIMNNNFETPSSISNASTEKVNETSLDLHLIDDVSEPYSPHGRERCWKLYLEMQSLREGLKHEDYDHVLEILKKAKPHEDTIYSRTCYRMLCREIEHSQHHLNKIIAISVRTGMTDLLYKILLNVALYILVYLVDEGFWVLAYKLLKDINMLQMQMRLSQYDAAFVLLSAQIYLANQQPLKALALLKQTKIIYANRKKWIAQSRAEDECTRRKTILLLLNALCEVSPEHALFLFEFLLKDQSNNFYPIDLTRFVDKIISVHLTERYIDNECIIRIGRLVDECSFALDVATYRALITKLIHVDMFLAQQLYQNAITLGVYSQVKFHPVIFVTMNPDWTEEEIYLMLLELIEKLSSNIGHGIDRTKAFHLAVYLALEALPPEKQFYRDEGKDNYYVQKGKKSVEVIRNILRRRFNPPIQLIQTNRGRFLKFNGTTLLNYLKSKHYN